MPFMCASEHAIEVVAQSISFRFQTLVPSLELDERLSRKTSCLDVRKISKLHAQRPVHASQEV
ncbi:hypothetical protein DEM27_20305 [Metarhizobium album]|uniref:Uncharacterized protein n=1 Tax=Metarhizobium album TaxID=2182425 RepID=A0A2U2DMD7_9HYPH|nr:hypothetical protein DEM27_20305 [Rhizobium album]